MASRARIYSLPTGLSKQTAHSTWPNISVARREGTSGETSTRPVIKSSLLLLRDSIVNETDDNQRQAYKSSIPPIPWLMMKLTLEWLGIKEWVKNFGLKVTGARGRARHGQVGV